MCRNSDEVFCINVTPSKLIADHIDVQVKALLMLTPVRRFSKCCRSDVDSKLPNETSEIFEDDPLLPRTMCYSLPVI